MRKILILMFIFCCCAIVNAQTRYQGEANVGFGIGVGNASMSKLTVNTIHGVRINQYLFIGAGIGYDVTTSTYHPKIEELALVFKKPKVFTMIGNVKGYYPICNKITLFLGMSVGYGSYGDEDAEWVVIDDPKDPWLLGQYAKGGLNYSPEIGCTYNLSREFGLNFALGYQAQQFNYVLSIGPKGNIDQADLRRTTGSLSIKVGLTW